jgi:dTDP-4-amino-4,6-dideoxygalactose transaminase
LVAIQTLLKQHVPFVDLAAQYQTIAQEIDSAIAGVVKRCDFILGHDVAQFEEEFAAYCEADYAVGVDSGMTALELALAAFDIGPGDEVIVPANTFIASALAISHTGATPVLVDVDAETDTMDPSRLRYAITRRTRGIIPVHLFGRPAEMDTILTVAREHGLIVIEDACQAHGARYKGRRVGSLGHAAAFSFYPGKNLGAYGDGGIVVTGDAMVAKRIQMLRNYGQVRKYYHLERGYNHRLDTIQAAVLRVKLKYLDQWNAARRQHASLYSALLAESNVVTPTCPDHAEPVWHLYVIRSGARDELASNLAAHGITTAIHYPIPIHLQSAYRDRGYQAGDFPVTERQAGQMLSLPMFAELTPNLIAYVAQTIRDFELRQDQVSVA